MLRFGLIGPGNIALTHAAAMRASSSARLVAVAGGDPAAELAAQEDAVHFEDASEMMADPNVDAVVLCTPSGVRRDYALEAAERGKHLLVEKPIDVSLVSAREIIEACERHGVTLGVVFQSRFKPHPTAVREVVAGGGLGEVVLGSMAVKWHRPPEYYASAEWRGTWAFDGGGALINQAIHNVDMLLWFLGDVLRVRAQTANRLHREIEVEDTVVAQLEFANGALGVIEASTAAFPGSARRIELHGTAGTVTLLDDEVDEWEFRDGTPRPREEVSAATVAARATHVMSDHRWHQLQIEDFVDAVARGRAPFVDGREGLRSLELVLAVYESARTGEVVEVTAGRA